jgi:hypothetical protein
MAQKPASFHILKPGRREPANRRPSSQQKTVTPKGAVKPINSRTCNAIPFDDIAVLILACLIRSDVLPGKMRGTSDSSRTW